MAFVLDNTDLLDHCRKFHGSTVAEVSFGEISSGQHSSDIQQVDFNGLSGSDRHETWRCNLAMIGCSSSLLSER